MRRDRAAKVGSEVMGGAVHGVRVAQLRARRNLMIEEIDGESGVRREVRSKREESHRGNGESEELRTAAIFMPSHAPFQRQSMIATSTAPASRYGLNPRRPSAHNKCTT